MISVKIPNEKFKMTLIGRDGACIKALQENVGVELIIDDTPEVVFLKGVDDTKVNLGKKIIEHMVRENKCSQDKILELVKLYS